MIRTSIISVVCIVAVSAVLYRALSTTAPPPTTAKAQQAMFSAGCFWGVEQKFHSVDGVLLTRVGFAGGHLDHPTYKDLCSGMSGHAETVQVTFDPARISYAEVLDAFWTCHDPTKLNITGAEHGEPERSIIFFFNSNQRQTAEASRDEVDASGEFKSRIRTEILPAGAFFPAEEYHQQYLAKLGQAAVCSSGEREIHTKLAAHMAAQRAAR
jgi:peptide-methionine (S)-S-oxide reductase